MDDIISAPAAWTTNRLWSEMRRAPSVVVLAGIERSDIVDAALADPVLSSTLLPRFEPDCSAPCDALLWRVETAAGQPLNRRGLIASYWHRKPYAMTMRLVRYQPASAEAEILDEGTVGTRGSRDAFTANVSRLAMRFVRDAALGRSRGQSTTPAATAPMGAPGWLNYGRMRWRDRLMTEWWSLGTTETPVAQLLDGSPLNDIEWYNVVAAERYLADPFPWPGTGMILCEDMPVAGGVGRIVAVAKIGSTLSPPVLTVLDDGYHHSYPCAFEDEGILYCIPEATERGATRINRLNADGELLPVCDVAPHARLSDPTLFKHNGRYWLACTDLDVGAHDNLCLLHATSLQGPWVPHMRWPVKIDIRGARAAGSVIHHGGRLFRPAQDCAATYGAAITINEIVRLSETDFAETPVRVLRPDPDGPFPHGLHTLTHDGKRFWVDGKRFVINRSLLQSKLRKRFENRRVQSGAA